MTAATSTTLGEIVLSGDLTGDANAPSLRASGVTPGTYSFLNKVYFDSKGRATSAGPFNLSTLSAAATTATSGVVSVGDGLSVSSGAISVYTATNSVRGVFSVTPGAGLQISGTQVSMKYSDLPATGSSFGWVTPGSNFNIAGNGTLSVPNASSLIKGAFSFGYGLTAPSITTSSPFPSDFAANSVIWTGTRFVAVGSSTSSSASRAYTSPDGITWTARTTPTPSTVSYLSVVCNANGSTIVAVGSSGVGTGSGACMYSTDGGITWTAATMPTSGTNVTYNSVAWNGTVYCATGRMTGPANLAATSPDGITWTARTMVAYGTTPADGPMTFGNGLFVATGTAGSANNCQTSPDGITWTTRTFPSTNLNPKSIIWSGTQFVVVGSIFTGMTYNAATSPDGINWTGRVMPSTANAYNTVLYANGKYYAFQLQGTSSSAPSYNIASSSDAITWNQVSFPTPSPVRRGDSVMTAVFANDRMMTFSIGVVSSVNTVFMDAGRPWDMERANDQGNPCVDLDATSSTTQNGFIKVGGNFSNSSGTISIPDATSSVKGVASFNPTYFNAVAGVVSLNQAALLAALNPATDTVAGLVKIGSGFSSISGVLSADLATTTSKGIAGYSFADFSVASGVVSLQQAARPTVQNTFLYSQSGTSTAQAGGSTFTPNFQTGTHVYDLTLNSNLTINFPSVLAPSGTIVQMQIMLRYDSTSAYTVTLSGSYATNQTLSFTNAAGGKIDMLHLICTDTVCYAILNKGF